MTSVVDVDNLFGIKNSNRTAEQHLGKNQFNSSFPTALANYMMSQKKSIMYNKVVEIDGELKVETSEISVDDIFKKSNTDELYFSFETVFQPYEKYSFDTIDGIDLSVKDINDNWLRALEVKLTVLPDAVTSKKDEKDWGSEIVVRSATTLYCALGMYDSSKNEKDKIRDIFETPCSSIQSWESEFEVSNKYLPLLSALNKFEKEFLENQQPLLMQTLWKTNGQSPLLKDDAFDIIIWSDFAVSRLFIDRDYEKQVGKSKMSRPMRATARLARCLWELSKSDKIHIDSIYHQMAYGTQTDKEFSVNGLMWGNFITDKSRILKPAIRSEELPQIISSEMIELLKPERRFDQTLYFTYRMNEE